jgi:hypothetical protein
MDTDILKAFLRLGLFIGGCGFLMIFMQPAGSAEFVLSICSALMGGVVVGGVFVLARLGRGRIR